MKPEKRRFVRAWIWFWYNNATRLFVVLFPSYFIFLIPALQHVGLEDQTFRQTLSFVYLAVFGWAVLDNDYSNLERIGLDVERRPLTKSAT